MKRHQVHGKVIKQIRLELENILHTLAITSLKRRHSGVEQVSTEQDVK